MRALVQRVNWAQVAVDGAVVGRVERGLLVYVGVGHGDDAAVAAKMADKVATLRIFDDAQGKLNLSVGDVGGGILAISNFTLLADAAKGRRPAFLAAAPGPVAQPIHQAFVDALVTAGCRVAGGVFGADMKIDSQADGPINVIVDLPAQ